MLCHNMIRSEANREFSDRVTNLAGPLSTGVTSERGNLRSENLGCADNKIRLRRASALTELSGLRAAAIAPDKEFGLPRPVAVRLHQDRFKDEDERFKRVSGQGVKAVRKASSARSEPSIPSPLANASSPTTPR